MLNPTAVQNETEPVVFGVLDPAMCEPELEVALEAYRFLIDIKSQRAEEFRTEARARWTFATVLDSEDDRKVSKARWLKEDEERTERENGGDF